MNSFGPSLQKLEFDRIRQRIQQLAVTDPGKRAAERLSPGVNAASIRHELQRVTELKELLNAEGAVPLDGTRDLSDALRRSAIENHPLTPQDLLDVAGTLRASRMLHRFLAARTQQYPTLDEFIPHLLVDKILEYNITEAIDESGHVRDGASKELKTIRGDMASLSEQIRKRLAGILRQVAEEELLQDEIITTCDGRFVIPVKVEFKHRVPGFIHSSSSSGATVFVEPAETLDLNNALRELQFREIREIERILRELTSQVSAVRGPLRKTMDVIGELDFVIARARYSIEIIGAAPRIVDKPVITLRQARHPLLLQTHKRDDVIPLDLSLGGDTRILVITGPNAGGKSVALKTIGLTALCVQSGLHVPIDPDSELPVFTRIFVDIGDDQSLEQDLSTFSSHLVNMKDLLTGADATSLVLVDEIGAGTDPAEGGALASSILLELLARKTLVVTTTHHGTLKAFAHETPGMANGSMEFDQKSLTPTYQFRFGLPGSSYALELAERVGMDHKILENARDRLGSEKIRLEALIVSLEKEIQASKQQQSRLAENEQKVQRLMTEYEERMAEVRREIRDLKARATQEAREYLQNAQSRIEHVIQEIKESAASRPSIQTAKKAIQEGLSQLAAGAQPEKTETDFSFAVRDRVRLHGGTEIGEIVSLKGESATVLWQRGTLKVPLHNLEPASAPQEQRPSVAAPEYHPEVGPELDLRGMTGDEALVKVEHFLDDALVAGLHRVDIIHGKGTGALRKRISEFLKNYPHAKSFRLGEWNEGGTGVTVVELSE